MPVTLTTLNLLRGPKLCLVLRGDKTRDEKWVGCTSNRLLWRHVEPVWRRDTGLRWGWRYVINLSLALMVQNKDEHPALIFVACSLDLLLKITIHAGYCNLSLKLLRRRTGEQGKNIYILMECNLQRVFEGGLLIKHRVWGKTRRKRRAEKISTNSGRRKKTRRLRVVPEGCGTCWGLLHYKDKPYTQPAVLHTKLQEWGHHEWLSLCDNDCSIQWKGNGQGSQLQRCSTECVCVSVCVCTLRNYPGMWGYMPKTKNLHSPRPLKKYHNPIKKPVPTATLDRTN